MAAPNLFAHPFSSDSATLSTPSLLPHAFDNGRPMCYENTMKVEIDGTIHDVEKPMEVSRLLQQFSLSRETHLVVVNDRLVTEDHRLNKDDRIRLIRVVSGG